MSVRKLTPLDVEPMAAAFAAIGWTHKSAALFTDYLAAQESGERIVLVAELDATEKEPEQTGTDQHAGGDSATPDAPAAPSGLSESDHTEAPGVTGVVGYLCVVWRSGYPPFRAAGTPEIVDFNVLPAYRRRGIGNQLMDAAEVAIRRRSPVAGLGAGLTTDYGAALLLYLRRGYVPDGAGLVYAGRPVSPGQTITVDDSTALMMTKRLH